MGWNDKDRASYYNCMSIAAQAKREKKWVNVGKDWFTPEEFEKKASAIDVNDLTGFKADQIKVADPIEILERMQVAISDKLIEIDEMQKKMRAFSAKVANYYKERGNK